MGTMRERRPGVWELRTFVGRDEHGWVRQVSTTFHGTKQAATKALAALDTEAAEGKHGRPDTVGVTVAELLERHLDALELRGRADKTIYTYRRYAETVIVPAIGSRRLRTLTAFDLDNFYGRLARAGRSPAVIRKVHVLLSGALRQAVKWGMVPVNVATLASPPPQPKATIRVPSAEQVRRILTEAERSDPMLGRVFMLAALTGARRGELCALRWRDVDLDAGRLRIVASVQEVPGRLAVKDTKSHQTRVIAVDNAAVALLRLHREDVDRRAAGADAALLDDGFVFSERSLDGSVVIVPGRLTRAFADIVRRLGIDGVTLHGLRHFVATQLAATGEVSARTLAGRLGHANASVTLRVYAEFFPAADVAAARHLGRIVVGGD